MKNYLIVVDMQNDFVTGSLGTPEAQAIVPAVREKILNHKGPMIFTLDTHGADYLNTQEGRKLPVPHCLKGTPGWEIVPELRDLADAPGVEKVEKGAFGSPALAARLADMADEIAGIELVGLCTDICVVTYALLLKASLPECPIALDSRCCAGVTPERHAAALETMRSCQIDVT